MVTAATSPSNDGTDPSADRGKAGGAFEEPVKIAMAGHFPIDLLLADLSGDGRADLAVANFGIGGPAGMEPAVRMRLHDAFKKTLEDPAVLASFDKYDQSVIYLNSDDYARYIREQFQKEKVLIGRLGLAMKS